MGMGESLRMVKSESCRRLSRIFRHVKTGNGSTFGCQKIFVEIRIDRNFGSNRKVDLR